MSIDLLTSKCCRPSIRHIRFEFGVTVWAAVGGSRIFVCAPQKKLRQHATFSLIGILYGILENGFPDFRKILLNLSVAGRYLMFNHSILYFVSSISSHGFAGQEEWFLISI
jgi:hypothetical protein